MPHLSIVLTRSSTLVLRVVSTPGNWPAKHDAQAVADVLEEGGGEGIFGKVLDRGRVGEARRRRAVLLCGRSAQVSGTPRQRAHLDADQVALVAVAVERLEGVVATRRVFLVPVDGLGVARGRHDARWLWLSYEGARECSGMLAEEQDRSKARREPPLRQRGKFWAVRALPTNALGCRSAASIHGARDKATIDRRRDPPRAPDLPRAVMPRRPRPRPSSACASRP